MNDMMKAFLGYDPDEVVKELVKGLESDLKAILISLDAGEYPDGTREFVRAVTIVNMTFGHQIAALALRPAGDPAWPAKRIYEALRETGVKVGEGER